MVTRPLRIGIAGALMICVSGLASAQGGAPAKPAPAPAPPGGPAKPAPAAGIDPALLPADLSTWFPRETKSYLEFDDVTGAIRSAGAEGAYGILFASFAREMAGSGKLVSSVLEGPELQKVLGASGAVAEFRPPAPAPASAGEGGDPAPKPKTPGSVTAGVVRMKDAAALAKLKASLLAKLGPALRPKPVAAVELLGSTVDVLALDPGPDSPAFAVLGREAVVGTVASVTAVLGVLGSPKEKTLSARPDMAAAVGRLGAKSAIFGLYPIVEEKPQSKRMAREDLPPEIAEQVTDEQLAEWESYAERSERIWGYGAFRSVAYSVRAVGGALNARAVLTYDADAAGLLPTLARMPAISMRAADFVPAQADLFWSVGLDLPGIYSLIAQPEGSGDEFGYALGLPFGRELPKMNEHFASAHGLSFKDDVLGAFGPEVAFARGEIPADPIASTPARKFALSVLEVRRPETLRLLIQKYNKMFPADSDAVASSSQYQGAELWQFGTQAWAFVDGVGIGGSTSSVKLALDARSAGQMLGGTPAVAQLVRSAPKTAGALVSIGPRYVLGTLLGTGDRLAGEGVTKALAGGGLTGTVAREAGVVTIDVDVRPGLFDAMASSIAPTQRRAGEASTVGNLRTLASAQAVFYSQKSRYGTLEELVEAQMLDDSWTQGGIRDGYRFASAVETKAEAGDAFTASAVPARYGEGGTRSFFVDESMVIRGADRDGAPATADDPAVGSDVDASDYESTSPAMLVPILGPIVALGNPEFVNQQVAGAVYSLYFAQQRFMSSSNRLGTVEELKKGGMLGGVQLDGDTLLGYRFEFAEASGEGGRSIAVTATPESYSPGAFSFYFDGSGGMAALDKGGDRATAADVPAGDEPAAVDDEEDF